MLKARVIPTLLWKGVGLVKGVGFDSWRRVGPVLPAIKVYNARDVDELLLVDIMAASTGERPDADSISDFARECFVPFTVGGGVSSIEDIQALLYAGADKVSINSAAYADPAFVTRAANRFGAQCIVASVDARRYGGGYRCFSHAGSVDTGLEPLDWALRLQDLGAGEILITSIDVDGTMQGYDLRLVELISGKVGLPVIASGGAGSYEHMRQAIQEAGASAVAAASMFHFTEQTPKGAREYLAQAGIPTRLNYQADGY